MLNIPAVQRKVMNFSETKLSDLLQTSVTIGKIDISWLNRFSFKEVRINDQKGAVLLKADNITAGFKLLPRLQKKWVLTTVRLFGVTCHINRETAQSESNIQFLVDALSGKTEGDRNVALQIESILIRRGSINYDVLDKEHAKQSFNPDHINIENLNGKFSVKHYSKDSILVQMSKLSFKEKAGLTVTKASARMHGNPDSLNIENLSLTLPRSSILIPLAAIRSARRDSLPLLSTQSPLSIRLASSTITPNDFACFTPVLRDFMDKIGVSADISGFINSISLDKLTVMYGKAMLFSGSLNLNNLTSKEEELYLFGQVTNFHTTTKGLQRVLTNFNRQYKSLPEPVMKIEELNFTGEISGFTNHLVAFGNLSSPIGSIQMDMMIGQQSNKDTTLYFKGLMESSELQIDSLFEEGNPFGKIRFQVELDMAQPHGKALSGTINAHINELEYHTYNYTNIYLSGRYSENEYEGLVLVNDPNGQLEMQGLFRNEDEKPVFDFKAQLTGFRPDNLHLTKRFEKPALSLGLKANFTGNNPDDFKGFIEMKDCAFETEKDRFFIDELRIETAAIEQTQKQINISSSLLTGEIRGNYSFSTLLPSLFQTVENYLPSVIHSVDVQKKDEKENVFNFNFTVDNTESVSKTLLFPVEILQKTVIQGHYNSVTHSLATTIDAPSLRVGSYHLENGKMRIDNTDEAINLQINVSQNGNNHIENQLHLNAEIKDDRIFSTAKWANNSDEKYEATLTTSTLFINEPDRNDVRKLRAEITIPPTQVILKDTIWTIEPASLTISDGRIMIDNFYLTNESQYLHFNGVISDHPNDVLLLDLNDIEISYIFNILNKPQIQFGGHATGTIQARDLLDSRMIEGRLEVENFSFHNAVQGKLKISSEWDKDRQGILLIGSIYKTDSIYTDVEGHIFPIGPEKGLSLNFNANELNLAFLQKYMKSFADSINGLGFGEARLYGPFSEINLEGTPYVKDVNMKVNLLNTSYTFSDTVYLDKQSIRTRNTTLYDRDKHTGSLDFILNHTNFKNMSYQLDIIVDNMLVYDLPERINPEIYGKVYATGTATISGTEGSILVDGNIRSNPGTSVGFNFANNSTVSNYDFITFKDYAENDTITDNNISESKDNNQSGLYYMLNFNVVVTPDAQFELMMNPATGDKISASGNGNFQIQYGSQSDIQMFGNYFISGGIYNFNLEQILRKRFNIRDGSIVSFHGNPLEADLNINAIYNLAANIQDLDEQLINNTASPTVSVNCVLKLDGHLQNPAISFDLELPNSNTDLERQVRSFIDTEDMMIRQIIYLLLLQKFYTPDYSRNDFRTNEFSAVASQALSAQLSNIFNSFTDKVQVGTLIRARQDGIKDTEIDMLLSSQLLNNRLLFNGNFGYKDNFIQSNAFVGEFDLEYKLTRSGEINLKAYNHANDLYRYTKSLTRQGVGVMFRKDFNLITDLFRRKKKLTETTN